jgi:hypothetical protein
MLVKILNWLSQREPSVTLALVGAIIALAVQFGVSLQDSQVEAIKDFAAALLAFVGTGFAIRSQVTSPATVQKLTSQQAAQLTGPK